MRLSPSDASRVGLLRCPGSQNAPKKCGKTRRKRAGKSVKKGARYGQKSAPKERAVTNPRAKPRPAARTRVITRVLLGLVTACDPSQEPGQRSGVNGPGPPRPAGGVVPEGFPLGGAWRSQAPPVNLRKSRVQRRVSQRGVASAGRRRSRRPALTGRGQLITRSVGPTGNLAREFTPDSTPDTGSG